MKTFKNIKFIKRDYEATNVIFCQAEKAPAENWVECDYLELELLKCSHLWTESGIRYFGYL